MQNGEERLWEQLSGSDPEVICRRTDAVFDASSGIYRLRTFGTDFLVSPQERTIVASSPDHELLLRKLGFFFRLSAIGYLTMAKDVAPSGRLIKPENMKSGQLFFRGSHVLPLDKVALKYGNNKNDFLKKGIELGGTVGEHGDASLTLFPFPRVPVVMILWEQDEEFPARADLLFDSVSEIQLPIDAIWSTAMMSVIAFL